MSILEWKTEYSVNVEEIDNQHKKVINFINELNNIVRLSNVVDTYTKTLQAMTKYALYHFEVEEKYFDEFNYQSKIEHVEEHHKYREQINNFNKQISDGGLNIV